jgi:prevent-host-death family protein
MAKNLSMPTPMLESTLGAFDAKTHFSKILEWVAKGKEFVVTKHGKPIARISPAIDNSQAAEQALIEKRRAAMAWIKANPIKLAEGQTVHDLIAEGRKW